MKLRKHREDVKYLIQTEIHNVFELDEIAKRYLNLIRAAEKAMNNNIGFYSKEVLEKHWSPEVKRVLKDSEVKK